jgi:DNA-binding NtrC family response regulator
MSTLTGPGFHDPLQPSVPLVTDPATGRNRILSVLCVYDDPLFLDRVCRNLEQGGDIFVEISVSVEDALHLMVYVFFDVIVTDCTVWQGTPHGFLKAVRQRKKTVPFIYFTRGKDDGIAGEARQFGPVRYLAWDDAAPVVPFDRLCRCIHEMAGQGRE